MKLITFFFLIIIASAFGFVFLYFNEVMSEQSGKSFLQELKEIFRG